MLVSDKFGLSAGVEGFYARSGEEIISGMWFNKKSYADYVFVNIPLLAQYHFGKFAVKAGLQAGIKASAKLHYAKTNYYIHDKGVIDGVFNLVNLSIPVAISYEFNIPIVLDLRCAILVTKLNKDSNSQRSERLTTVMFSVGYRF